MIYYVLAVFLGPFYLLNLVLAVVSASYEQEVNGDPDFVSTPLKPSINSIRFGNERKHPDWCLTERL